MVITRRNEECRRKRTRTLCPYRGRLDLSRGRRRAAEIIPDSLGELCPAHGGPTVRIRFPPAESPSLNGNSPAEVEKRGFSRRCTCGAVGRRAAAVCSRALNYPYAPKADALQQTHVALASVRPRDRTRRRRNAFQSVAPRFRRSKLTRSEHKTRVAFFPA